MDEGWGARGTMRTRSEAAPLLRWTLARLGLSLLALAAAPVAGHAADPLVPLSGVYDTRILLTLGITLGIASLFLIVLLILFGWRKRAYKSNFGTLDGWLQAHLYFGIVALPLVLLHGAFLFRDTLATAAFVVLALLVSWRAGSAFCADRAAACGSLI